MWRIISGTLSRTAHKRNEVCLGAIYRRLAGPDVVETARVINIERDGVGIPHVFYDVTVTPKSGLGGNFTERRALNLATFRKEFSPT